MSEINAQDLNTNAPEVAVVPATPLTRAEKLAKTIDTLQKRIAADTAKIEELQLEAETSGRLAGVVEGTVISAKLGRAETTRIVTARVVGIKEEESGARKFKILFGSGIDTDTVIIQESQIVEVLVEEVAA